MVCVTIIGFAWISANLDYKDQAKRLYRHIIIKYTGFYYKSYVKQAEFGLEDLKE